MARLGAEIEIHPKVSEETDRRPDFRVQLPSGFEFYLEARLATGASNDQRSREYVITELARHLNARFREQRYFLAVQVEAQGKTQPSATKIEAALYRYLGALNPDLVGSALSLKGFATESRFIWERDGWRIVFTPIPRKQDSIGKPFRAMGAHLGKAEFSTAKADIRSAVEYKCKHHTNLSLPYIVAVNHTRWTADTEDFFEALYGTEAYTVAMTSYGPTQPILSILRDGVWLAEDGPRNQNLFAVIGVVRLDPTNVASRSIQVFENPCIE